MKNWKKILLGSLAATALSATCALYAACKVDTGIVNKFVVDETQTLERSGEAGASVEFPEVTKEGYVFKGWYTNSDFIGMPVTSATYDTEVTYYARWAKGYEVKFELDGGTMDLSSKLYLEEGASVATSVQNYTPVYGDYQFGGWYVGDEPLAANERMTTAGITLTARYKAEYSVDVYLQSIDSDDVYVKNASYVTGYALIGEEYTPEVAVNGFSVITHENEVTELDITGNKNNNVFSIYYDRNYYTLTLSANYPNGEFDTVSSSYMYEKEFALPENTFAAYGCRFVGWATSPGAGFADVIKDDKYALKEDEVLYAVWNVGLVDMFSGTDRIFRDPENPNKIILNRGGLDIEGTYDEIREVYTLRSDVDSTFKINVKLRDDGKFVYLSSRQGSYVLITERGTLDTTITMIFDDYDGCEYNSRGTFTKSGTYSINEDGEYTATVIDAVTKEESTVTFKIGLTYNSSGMLVNAFKIRGDESDFGPVPGYSNRSFYYPIYTFDGYGSVDRETPGNQHITCSYVIDNGVVTVYTVQNLQQVTVLVARFDEVNGQIIYKSYNANLDKEYRHAENNNITITLDGCSTIVYNDGANSYTGTYADVIALQNGCHIIAVQEEGGTTHTYLLNGVVFSEEENVNGVYFFYDGQGYPRTPILITKNSDSETAEAALLGIDGNFWGVISSGELVDNGAALTYTVTGDIAEWASDKYTELKLVIGGFSTGSGSYPVYFLLSAKEQAESGEENEISFATVYVDPNDGSKLTLTEAFVIYEKAGEDSQPLLGMYTKNSGYITVNIGNDTLYFILTKATEEGEENTFEQLANAPFSVGYLFGGTMYLPGVTIKVTGRIIDGKQEAIYDTGSYSFYGFIESEVVNVFGSDMRVYKFSGHDADKNMDEAFYFTTTYDQSQGMLFTDYKSKDVMVLGRLTEVGEDGTIKSDNSIQITADNKFTYVVGKNKTVGTWTLQEINVFGVLPITVYTFTPDDENAESFRFTLRTTSDGVYFLIAGENNSYTAKDGSTFVLDGLTHVGQYTDKDGAQYENYYWTAENILDNTKPAYLMYVNNVMRYFDVDGNEFTLRGTEGNTNNDENTYEAVKNGSYSLEKIKFTLDGYGNVVAAIEGATKDDEQTVQGTYTLDNGLCTIVLEGGKTYKGHLSYYSVLENGKVKRVPAFYVEIEGYSGNYLNRSDLSVLVLDAIGGAVKYGSYGSRESGSYVIIDNGLIYYMNANGTSAAIYSIEGNTVEIESTPATYYADDLSGAMFNANGNLIVGRNSAVLYVFDSENSKFTVYDRADSDTNEFGFTSTEYTVSEGSFVYGGKTYHYFDGRQLKFTSEDGSTLEFTPSGSVTFSAKASYKPAGAESAEDCYVITGYNRKTGEFAVTLSRDEAPLRINGSVSQYNFAYEYLLDIDLSKLSFEVEKDSTTIGLIAYDYDFYVGNTRNESLIIISAEEGEDGEMNFSVQGHFTFSSYVLYFEDGKLSKAGGAVSSNNPANTFICEFTGDDNNVYHLYFMLLSNKGDFVFIPCPLVRVAATQELDEEGSVYYAEKFVYGASTYNFEQYKPENAYYRPTIKYKDELICATAWGYKEDGNTIEWKFLSHEYTYDKEANKITGNSYLYVVDFNIDDEKKIESSAIAKFILKDYESVTHKVSAWTSVDDGSIYEIYAVTQSQTLYVKECVKNADGSFNITVDAGGGLELHYVVKFVEGADGKITVNVNWIQNPGQGGGDVVETPEDGENDNGEE